MNIYRAIFLFVIVIATVNRADTIVLQDGTRAAVSIADTSGSGVIVEKDGISVRIGKKKIQQLVFNDNKGLPNKNSSFATPLSISGAIKKKISAGVVCKQPVFPENGIVFLKSPVVQTGEDNARLVFFNRLGAFLTKSANGMTRERTKEGFFFLLADDSAATGEYRYCAFAYEFSHTSKERKTGLASFAELDTAGNFVPSRRATALHAHETETSVRFLIYDREGKKTVFDEKLRDVDKGLADLDLKTGDKTQSAPGNNSILSVENKLEALLKKQFK